MRADLIDIQIVDHGDDVEIYLSGELSKVHLPAVREKIEMLTDGPGCFYFLNLQKAHFKVKDYLNLFLEILNKIRGKKSALVLVFTSEELKNYFAGYKNIFEIYESREAYKNSGISKQLSLVGLHYGKKAGIHVSQSVAVAMALLIVGWAVSLFAIVTAQGKEIAEKHAMIIALQSQKDRYIHEIGKLEAAIGPLRKLGAVQDTAMLNTFGAVKDWASYLEYLENSRREE